MSEKLFYFATATESGEATSDTSFADDLATAIQNGIKSASYYFFSCGYQNPSFSIYRKCTNCNGCGKVRAKRKMISKKCPECKGKDSEVAIVESAPFTIHENALTDINWV